MQRLEELADEEGIAAGLGEDCFRERTRRGRLLPRRVRDEPRDLIDRERRQAHGLHAHAQLPLLAQREHERMPGGRLLVAIRLHEEQRLRRGRREQHRDEVEAGGVGPLHVVEEQHERRVRVVGALLRAEELHEALEHEVEAVLRRDGVELRHGRLRPDDQLQRGQHVEQQPAVRRHGGLDRLTPVRERALVLGEELLHEILERGDEAAEGNVAPELVELAGREVSAPARDRLVDLLHERRLADAPPGPTRARTPRSPSRRARSSRAASARRRSRP